jgi:hypothetical protein
VSKRKPKRDMDERHSVPADDPEEALKALVAVDPEAGAKLTNKQVEKLVRDAISDPKQKDEPGPGSTELRP